MAVMADNIDKIWDRPWTTEEIIENADKWTLAGDVALLNTLKSFADKMFKKTETVTNNIDSLLNNIDEVQLKLDITQNEFYSLKNSQFIESRVYEDDETLDSKADDLLVVKETTGENQEKLINESIKVGLDVMQKYYDNIEVSISDSEDEYERSYIIKPKDVYIHRPLPPLFGSKDWNEKWYMEDTSSESESEKVSEIYSESDAEDALPKDSLKGSETSSELDLHSHTGESKGIDSTINESSKKTDSIISSDGSNGLHDTEHAEVPAIGKSFVEQLTATLGNITSQQRDPSYQEVNRRPIQPVKSDFIDRLFPDEPPPLDDIDGDEATKTHIGIFSGGHGLFDDDEDDFWESSSKETKTNKIEGMAVHSKKYSDSSSKSPDVNTSNSLQHSHHGLFDSDNDENTDDLFSNKPVKQQEKSINSILTTEVPVDEKMQEQPKKVFEKKPVGGVLVCGSLNMFNNEKVKNILNSSKGTMKNANEAIVARDKISLFDEKKPVVVDTIRGKKKTLFDDDDDNEESTNSINENLLGSTEDQNNDKSKNAHTKGRSLFDDDHDIFKNDLFASIPTNSSNLFDDFVENDDIFSIRNQTKSDVIIKNKVDSLFSDLEEKDNDEFLDIFIKSDHDKKSNTAAMKMESEIIVNNLFDDSENVNFDTKQLSTAPKVDQHSVVGTNAPICSSEKTQETDLPTSPIKHLLCEKEVNYASVEQQEIDSNHEVEKMTIPEPVSKFDDLFEKSSIVVPSRLENKPEINLFGSTPPPVDDVEEDDDWDVKSDNSNSVEIVSYHAEDDRQAGLFDNEPPSLYFNDTSGIVKDFTNTRMDSVDTSFNPYASSSRRLSSDIFSDQQSQDSFYVTKNQTVSEVIPSDLSLIQEDSSNSALSITPREDVDVFETIDDKIEEKKNFSIKSDDKDINELLKSTVKTDKEDRVTEENIRAGIEVDSQLINEVGDYSNKSIQSVSEDVYPEPKNSVSRLKQNLNINVNALRPILPGSAVKHQSLAEKKENAVNQSNLEASKAIVRTEKAITFDDNIQNLEYLPSITKDRAKIPIKRKPSTRRGRQEAIRKSAVDLMFDSDDNSQVQSVSMTHDLIPDVSSVDQREVHIKKDKGYLVETIHQLHDSSDVNDHLDPLFGVPKCEDELSSLLSTSANTSKNSNTSSNIFSQDDKYEDLFSTTTNKSSDKKSKITLFDSEDDTEPDLFGKTSKPALENKKIKKSFQKKILFDDSSSDDDLFAVTSNNNKSKNQGRSEKKSQAPSIIRKLENVETTDNPLSDIFK